MKFLSLSTAEHGCSVAVFDRGRLVCEEYWESRLTHSRRLIRMIGNLVENRSGWRLSDLDAFLAAKGPGSFTGLRIGISVARGLAYALGKPVAGISSLDGIAWRFSHASRPVCAMLDAKRGEVYAAVYRFENGRLAQKSDESVCSPRAAVASAGNPEAVFAGSGSKAYESLILEQTREQAVIAPGTEDYVSASALGRVALMSENFFGNPENELLPTYLRKSDAEIQYIEKT